MFESEKISLNVKISELREKLSQMSSKNIPLKEKLQKTFVYKSREKNEATSLQLEFEEIFKRSEELLAASLEKNIQL